MSAILPPLNDRQIREQLEGLQRSRDDLRLRLLSQMDNAAQQLGTVTLGSVARDLAPNGELALQIDQLNVRAEQLSFSLASKDLAKSLARSTSEYAILRQKLVSARSVLSVLDRIAACARALRRIKQLLKAHDLVEATIQVFRLQTEIRDLSATLASAATDDASPEDGAPDPRPSTRLTSNLNLARYSTAGVAAAKRSISTLATAGSVLKSAVSISSGIETGARSLPSKSKLDNSKEVKIVRVLREEMAQLRAEAEFALAECWRQAVRWESGASRVQLTLALERIPAAPPDDEDEDEDENGCSTAGADSGPSITLAQLVHALHIIDAAFYMKIKSFTDAFIDRLLKPLLKHEFSEFSASEQNGLLIITCNVRPQPLSSDSDSAPSTLSFEDANKMFTWLLQLFGALYKAFNVPLVQPSTTSPAFSKEASPSEGTQARLGAGDTQAPAPATQMRDEGPFICLVNRELNQTLVHLLISHSLRPLLPNSVEQFETVSTRLPALIERLHAELSQLELFSAASAGVECGRELLQVSCTLHSHVVEKSAQAVLTRVRALALDRSYDSLQLPCAFDEQLLQELLTRIGGERLKERLLDAERLFSTAEEEVATPAENKGTLKRDSVLASWEMSGVKFPKCRISGSVQKLVKVLYDELIKISQMSTEVADCSSGVLRDAIMLYISLVPNAHETNIEKLPHVAAVQYNNAMYLARYLLWFQCLQRPLAFAHLEEATGPDTPTRRAETAFYPSAWLSFALPLRALAQDCLIHHLRAQREQTLEILNETGGLSEISDKADRVSRAFHQVEQLWFFVGRLWSDSLPSKIRDRALGMLMNVAFDWLASSLFRLEDIGADEADILAGLFNSWATAALEALFPSEDGEQEKSASAAERERATRRLEASRQVDGWTRHEELGRLLQSSMSEVEVRWTSGKGPLADVLAAGQLRALVKALFQNNDRRAALLTKIGF